MIERADLELVTSMTASNPELANLQAPLSSNVSMQCEHSDAQRCQRDSAIVIEPRRGWVSLKIGEMWEYRELLYFLSWRDIKVRYKQTALGAAWAIIQPFFTMLVFSLFFGRLAKVPSDGIP